MADKQPELNLIDRAGVFRAEPIQYQLRVYDSGAMAVRLRFKLLFMLDRDTREWLPWEEYEQECFGSFFVVGKNGNVLRDGIRRLCKATGWDGSDIEDWENGDLELNRCQVFIKEGSDQDGNVRYEAEWVNPWDYVPRRMGGGLDPVKLEAARKYKRRIAAAARGASAGSETAPPAVPVVDQPAGPVAPQDMNTDDLPF